MNWFNQLFIEKMHFSSKIQVHVISFSDDKFSILKEVNVYNPHPEEYPPDC